MKFSPRKLRDTFIICNAFLSDEMVSVNKEVTWPRVSITLIYQLVSGGKFTLKKKKKEALSDFPKRSKNITFGSKDGRQIGGL